MKKTPLSDSQKNVLQLGHDKGTFTADDLPLKGAPRKKVLESLLKKQLIKIIKRNDQWQDYALTPEGRQVIGAEEPQQKASGKIRTGTKLHRVIELLSRPEGAAIADIMQETGWQQHTVRGTLAGALKKRLGLTIDSEKPEGKDRIYRITAGLDTLSGGQSS